MKNENESDKMQYFHYIYKIIFLCGEPVNRYYIGKRTYCGDDITKDKYCGSGNFCKTYFKKYGVVYNKTYLKEILEINQSYEINKERERIIIGDKWNTDSLCMNIRAGGDGGFIPGHKISVNGIKNLIAVNSKPVYQFDLNGKYIQMYPSAKEAGVKTNICRSKISSCCSGKRLTAGGYIWKLNNNIEQTELDFIKKHNKTRISQKRKIIQINIETGQEIIYNSIREASRLTKIHNGSISEVCSGKRNTAGGYKWKYVEE